MRVAHKTHPIARGKKILVTVAWNGVPAPNFAPGSVTPYDFSSFIDGYSASTDTVTVASGGAQIGPGSANTWVTLSGATLVPNGTQVDANDFSGLILRVTRSGAPAPADSAAFSVLVSNLAPVWINVPSPSFVSGVASNFPASGTYQSNGYVTDGDGDTIAITRNSVFVQGLNWTGGRFEFDGTGTAQLVSGHILTANDGAGHLVPSSPFSVTINPGVQYGWVTGITNVNIPISGSFALTDIYVEAPGETPNWDIVLKEAELGAIGFTLVGDSVVHDGRNNPDAFVSGVQIESDASEVASPSWTANPDTTFTAGVGKQVDLGDLVADYNAATDTFSFVSGTNPAAWLTIQSNTLVASGAQLDSSDFTGLRIRVTRTGASAPADTASLTVAVAAGPTGGALTYVGSHHPLLETYGYDINFGKHTSWAQGLDGKWYTFSGDGNHAGIASYGGSSRWWRWDPNSPSIVDYFYPRVGIPGKENPCNPDCHPWVRRANGTFIAPTGKAHGWAGERDAPPFGPDIGITIPGPTSADPAFDVYYNWKYNPTTQTWTKSWNFDFSCNECNTNESYDPATDRFFFMGPNQAFWTLDCETLVASMRVIPNLYLGWGRQQQQIYCAATNELFAIDSVGVLGGEDVNGEFGAWAINVDTGARRVLCNTGIVYSNAARTSGLAAQAGSTPFVFVPSRRRLYIFLWEWFEYAGWHNVASYDPPFTIDGGIIEFTFNADYTSYTMQNIPYPTAIRDYASTLPTEVAGRLHKSVFINNAFYDPVKDRIYGINGNGSKIFEWRYV
jgi:hypothetical protein